MTALLELYKGMEPNPMAKPSPTLPATPRANAPLQPEAPLCRDLLSTTHMNGAYENSVVQQLDSNDAKRGSSVANHGTGGSVGGGDACGYSTVLDLANSAMYATPSNGEDADGDVQPYSIPADLHASSVYATGGVVSADSSAIYGTAALPAMHGQHDPQAGNHREEITYQNVAWNNSRINSSCSDGGEYKDGGGGGKSSTEATPADSSEYVNSEAARAASAAASADGDNYASVV